MYRRSLCCAMRSLFPHVESLQMIMQTVRLNLYITSSWIFSSSSSSCRSVGRSSSFCSFFFSFLSAPVIDRFLVLNIKAKDVTTVKDKKKTNQNKMSWTGVYGDLIRKGKVSSSSFDKYFDFNWQTRRKGCWWRGKVIWRVLVSSSFINKRKTNQFVWSFSFTYFFFFNVLVR